jgi:hypothetical protein
VTHGNFSRFEKKKERKEKRTQVVVADTTGNFFGISKICSSENAKLYAQQR